MRCAATFAAFALGLTAFGANAPDWLVGSYRQNGKSQTSFARILIRSDGTFSFASNESGVVTATSGRYEFSGHQIRLDANDAFPSLGVKVLSGKVDTGLLEFEGRRYAKVGPSKAITHIPSANELSPIWPALPR